MKKPIVVNLFAGPGAGKSTTRAGVFSLLKLHGVNAEEAPEFAKDLTWEQRHATLRNQYYVWGKQHHRQFRLIDDVDVIVTDSPLILSIVYSRIYGIKNDEFSDMVLKSFNEFNNISFFVDRKKKYNPKGRSQDEDEAKAIDSIVQTTLTELFVPYTIVPGTFEGINSIAQTILRDHIGENDLGVIFTKKSA